MGDSVLGNSNKDIYFLFLKNPLLITIAFWWTGSPTATWFVPYVTIRTLRT